jgi:hypothetical protein
MTEKMSYLGRTWVLGVLLCLSFTSANSAPLLRDARASGISGSFIQYQSWMMQLNASKWRAELDSMYNAGIRTLVIQWLKCDQSRFFTIHAPGNDPTELILNYADTHGMQVHLGLYFEKEWWSQWSDRDYLNRVVAKNQVFATQVNVRYGKHPSFSGWYIPYELSDLDFDAQETATLNTFLRKFSSGLRKITKNRLPISVSAFFQGNMPAKWVEKNYSKIFEKSGIDILLLQDGVGAHNWNVSMSEKLKPYFQAYRSAATKNHIRTWGVLENFSTLKEVPAGHPVRSPAEMSRLREQLKFHSAQGLERTLAFDFFHYMSPLRGAAQKKLYEEYLLDIKAGIPVESKQPNKAEL